jgi:hypothetical protein
MAFPAGLSNGQTTTINGVVYVYSATDNAWTRVSTPFGNLAINGNLSANIATFTGNLYANANIITSNVFLGNLYWSNGSAISFSTYSNSNVAAYLTTGTVSITNLSVGTGIQTDVLNLNNNNLYNVNTIRINDPGASEGISWEGGSGWNIYESPNDLSNATGNLQIVLSGVRALTVDTNQTVNIPSTWATTSATTGALTVGGGVGIGGNLWVAGNIFASNLVSIGTTTLSVTDPLLYLNASNPSPYNYDIGFYSHFVGGALSRYQHTGFSRNSSDNTWTLFSNVFSEPGATISWTEANIIYDPIKVGSANIANTTVSTSTTTGALVVGGGVGIAGALYIANTGDVSANIGAYQTYANVYPGTATTFVVTNAGAGAYVINSESNPALYLVRGQKYNFSLNASGHPFWIKTAASTGTGDQYNTGVVNNGDDVGLITFEVPLTAPDTLYYICQYHSMMSGQLRIVNFATIDANIGTLFLGNTSTNANLGEFQSYANTKIGNNSNGNLVVVATTTSTDTTTGALVVGGGAGIAGNAYVGGNIVVTSNVSANKIFTTQGLYWSGNGVAFSSGGGGGGGTVDYVASPTPPVSPDNGDFWYKTTTGILFQYLSDGTNAYWFDVQTQTISGNVTVSSTSASDILSPFLLGGM